MLPLKFPLPPDASFDDPAWLVKADAVSLLNGDSLGATTTPLCDFHIVLRRADCWRRVGWLAGKGGRGMGGSGLG